MSVRFRIPSLVVAAALVTSTVHASESQGWRWSITPYAWATDVGVDVSLDGRQVVSETIPVEDLLEDIDATFQGRIEARNGRHGLLLDVFYVSMSDSVQGFALPQGLGQGDLDWKMDMTIADVAGTYDPDGDGEGLSYLYGTRIIDQRFDADARFTTSGGTNAESYGGSDTLFDVLAGVRYSRPLGEHWRFQSQLDVSTGGTEYTWSAFPSFSYGFGDGSCSLLAGYRHMSIRFEEQGGLESEMSLSGPVLGLRFSF